MKSFPFSTFNLTFLGKFKSVLVPLLALFLVRVYAQPSTIIP